MAYDPVLAGRVRAIISGDAEVTERKMFGGLAFLLDGNFAVSAYRDGGLMIRCSDADWPAFCSESGAKPMLRKGAPVSGWVQIAADAVRDEDSLSTWVERGRAFAATQTPN